MNGGMNASAPAPPPAGLRERVTTLEAVTDLAARYLVELRDHYHTRIRELEDQVYGAEPRPELPPFPHFHEYLKRSMQERQAQEPRRFHRDVVIDEGPRERAAEWGEGLAQRLGPPDYQGRRD